LHILIGDSQKDCIKVTLICVAIANLSRAWNTWTWANIIAAINFALWWIGI